VSVSVLFILSAWSGDCNVVTRYQVYLHYPGSMRFGHLPTDFNTAADCQMREVTDKAIQQLYWACRHKKDFPGQVPDESGGLVSTTDVLKGLGLLDDDFETLEIPRELEVTDTKTEQPFRALLARNANPPLQPRIPGPVVSPSGNSQSYEDSTSKITEQQTQTGTSIPIKEIDMKDQFLAFSPRASSFSSSISGISSHSIYCGAPVHHDRLEDFTDLDSLEVFIDTNCCTPSITSNSLPSSDVKIFTAPALMQPAPLKPFMYQLSAPLLSDTYMCPWPGSFAAEQQTVSG
jgi:hypothetical protein